MRSPTFLPRCAIVVLLAIVAYMPGASPARAGVYSVTSCFGPENASWTEWEPSPFVTAYPGCPGGVLDLKRPLAGEGLIVRNVVGRGHAPRGAVGALRFDAPAGTRIAGVDFDARMTGNAGWVAGIHDATNDRWLWCGPGCLSSFGIWLHEELRGLATQRIQALVRCVAARCRRDARRAFVALRNIRVHLDDRSAPRLSAVRGALVTSGGAWLRGAHAIAFDAADNSGIRVGRVQLDGRIVHEDARRCDFTRALPCSGGTVSAVLDTRTWADGAHRLRLSAVDAGGNAAAVERVVRVDNGPPAEPMPLLEGGDGWSPIRVRTLMLPLPPGQFSPLLRARVRACRAGGPCQESAPPLRAGRVPVTAFAGPGEYAARVALEDAAGNVGPRSAPVTLRFDDVRPGAPDLSAADEWRRGGALPLAVPGARPVSGIRGYRVLIGGRQAVFLSSIALDTLPEGRTAVEVSAISRAGLESTAVRTLIGVDRSPPRAEATGGSESWSRLPVRLALQGRDQPGLSGVRSLTWQVDGGAEASAAGAATTVEIAADGRHTISFRAIDGAGNSSAVHTVSVKVDRTPPETVAFEAPDPADPLRVSVVVADRTSGVASGRIELRGPGPVAWRPLATARSGDRLVARLDDAALAPGAYEVRARAVDAAGNESLGTRRVDGAPADLTLPLRRRTAVTVRRDGRTLHARLTAFAAPLAGDAALSPVGAEPLADRVLSLSQRLRGRSAWRSVCPRRTVVIASASGACTLRTDAAGRVEVRLPAGPSRILRLAFAGDALLLPASGTAAVVTPARPPARATPNRPGRRGGSVLRPPPRRARPASGQARRAPGARPRRLEDVRDGAVRSRGTPPTYAPLRRRQRRPDLPVPAQDPA